MQTMEKYKHNSVECVYVGVCVVGAERSDAGTCAYVELV